jgi:hypothetical protein
MRNAGVELTGQILLIFVNWQLGKSPRYDPFISTGG